MRSFKTKIGKLLFVVFAFATVFNTASVSALDVKQESLVVQDKSATITVLDAGISELKIAPKLEFNRLGDFITYKLTLKNYDGKKYKITGVYDDNSNSALELTYGYLVDMNADDKEILLTIKYVSVSSVPLTTVNVTIGLLDEDDNNQHIHIPVPNTNYTGYTAPDTGANTVYDTESVILVQKSLIIYIALVTVVGVVYINIRRKHSLTRTTKAVMVATLVLGLVPSMVIAASVESLQFVIDFSNVTFNGPYSVTFDTGGGTPVPSVATVNHGETVAKPTNPNKTGYTFSKWLNGASEYDFTTPVTGDLGLTAEYNVINYSISYELNGGTVASPNPITYNIESSDIVLNNPTKSNHAFKGWVTGSGQTPELTVTIPQGSTGDKSYEAIFNPIYTVTYDVNGGDAISPNTFSVENGDEIGALITPTREHYDFSGWYVGSTKVESDYVIAGNTTIVAKWTPKTYTITYNLNGGTETTNPTEYTIATPDFTLNNPTPPSADKAFAGWLDISDPLNPSTTPVKTITITKGTTGNKSYKATYKNFYTVTFDVGASNDTPPQDRIILDGDKIGTLPNGPKPIEFVIYGFDGWYVGDTKITENYEITNDTTVVAKYVKKTVNNGIEDLVNEDVTDTGCATNGIGLVVSDDPDSNARYIGACPSNYVSFNGELWRIIGVFNGIDDGTGKEEKRTKIIRDEPLKTINGTNLMPAFDVRYENSDPYYQGGGWRSASQWGDTKLSNGTSVNGASLQRKLNTDYLYGVSNPETTNGKPNSRWYHTRWNQVQTSNFDRYDATQSLNDEARSLIGDAVWKTGAAIYNGSGSRIIASTMYNQERSTNLPTNNAAGLVRTTTWTGKVGLVYPSDYLYSPAGSTDETRAKCIVGDVSQQACEVHTWLAPKTYKEYTITPAKCPSGSSCDNRDNQAVWVYAGDGGSRGVMYTTDNGNNGGQYYTHRPVVYLKSNVRILSGTGEKTNPFRIGFSNE